MPQETPETATVSLKGNTSGRATVKARFSGSDKARVVKQIKTGTEVRILEEKGDYCRVEADDFLLWIHKDYLTRENAEAAEAAE